MNIPTAQLILGDCLDVLKTLPDGSVDAVITDPPYGIGLENHGTNGGRRTTQYLIAGDDGGNACRGILEWAETKDLVTITFASPWNPHVGNWRNLIVWDKGGAVGGGGDTGLCLKRTGELIQVARNRAMFGGRSESVWRYPSTPQDTLDHIAAKPVALMRELVKKFTCEGDTILDPFMGSGTTGVACMQTGRNFIGVEIEPKYFEIAKARIEKARAAIQLPLVEAIV